MNTQSLFSFRPQMQPYEIRPSEDSPTELILLSQHDGAALGITHVERRLIEFFDGGKTVGEIIAKVNRETRAPLSSLRRLLWDLDRYGFLRQSPWDGKAKVQAPGYWGDKTDFCFPLPYVPLLGRWESVLGHYLLSVRLFAALAVWIPLIAVNSHNLFDPIRPLQIQGSTALAVLVILITLLLCSVMANGIIAAVLQGIHPASVAILADCRYGFPIFRLDGRRLRSQPLRKAFRAALSPALLFLGFSFLLLLTTPLFPPDYREWVSHAVLGLWLSVFLLTSPWNSTVLSREVVLRLRGSSVVQMYADSVRQVIFSRIRRRHDKPADHKLYTIWGIWSLLYTLAVFQFGVWAFRWDYPWILRGLVEEKNPLVLALLFLLLAVSGAVLASIVLTVGYRLAAQSCEEVRHRFWPQRDSTLVGLGIFAALFLLTQMFWTAHPQWVVDSNGGKAALGAALVGGSLLLWRREGRGGESLFYIPFLFCGTAFGLQGMYHLFLYSPPTLEEIYFFEATGTSPHYPLLPGFALASLFFSLVSYAFYLLFFYTRLFRMTWGERRQTLRRGCVLLPAWIGLCWLILHLPLVESPVGRTARIALILVTGMLGLLHLGSGSARNHSTTLAGLSLAMLFIGMLWNLPANRLYSSEHWYVVGLTTLMGAWLLRASAVSKTALGYGPYQKELNGDWRKRSGDIGKIFQKTCQDLYRATPRITPPAEVTSESLRKYLKELHRIVGTRALQAIARGVALKVPWHVTQTFANSLPVSVSFPPLIGWSSDRIERKLRRVPTFHSEQPEEMKKLVSRVRFGMFQTGETLIHQGENEGELYLIVEGQVIVEQYHPVGHSPLTVLGTDDFAGEIGFLAGSERTASIRALQPTLVLRLSRQDITEDMPDTWKALREAERGEGWQTTLDEVHIFSEFPSSLNARVYLESEQVELEKGGCIQLENPQYGDQIAVFLSGKGSIILEDRETKLIAGQLVGLEDRLRDRPLRGCLRAEDICRILWVDKTVLLEAMAELLTPQEIFQNLENHAPKRYLQERTA